MTLWIDYLEEVAASAGLEIEPWQRRWLETYLPGRTIGIVPRLYSKVTISAGVQHIVRLTELKAGTWPRPQLTTGCRCQEAPGWYPGRPAAELCPLHGTHRHTCPGVRYLGRSWRSEGCGWRCPKCGAEYTLVRASAEYGDHTTQYGTHPRTQCGPGFCDLLPPRPIMEWTRDAESAGSR